MREDDDDIQEYVRPWVGLTDEERDAMIGVTDLSGTYYYDDLYAVILLAEGKLKEKNAM